MIGLPKVGVQPNEIGITETLNDARSIWLTPNTTTIYVTSIVDTSDGPMVLIVPPGILALMDDAAFQYVADFGPLGADKGKSGKNYKVELPAPIPAKNFWSFMAYSGQTRSILETDQKSGGLDSKSPDLVVNEDGSVTVSLGPEAPKDKEGNWIQTMPGKSYNMMLRLYGPLETWFDKSWRPGDFELVE